MPPAVLALLDAAPDVRMEVMNDFFVKHHLGDGRALHHFTAADEGDEWHDHPWGFTSEVLHGGYVDEVVVSFAPVTVLTQRRRPGTIHSLEASHIHRITRLLDDECWTLVTAGPVERQVRFYRHRNPVVQSRLWNEGWPS